MLFVWEEGNGGNCFFGVLPKLDFSHFVGSDFCLRATYLDLVFMYREIYTENLEIKGCLVGCDPVKWDSQGIRYP